MFRWTVKFGVGRDVRFEFFMVVKIQYEVFLVVILSSGLFLPSFLNNIVYLFFNHFYACYMSFLSHPP
jgi:hypothetical protein